ncbi:GntR family transcriptional regulator [Oscillospiraceae bacterium LTW-04]|nr:GntR family transcriptional regulator [Oscillospiraceae bacterium MB24-C1]
MPENTMAKGIFAHQPSLVTPTYKEQAYQMIKDAILFQRFQVGVMYSQESICKELGISRTPVREALLELQKEGFVTYSRNKGIQVVPITQTEAHDILEMRSYIEKLSAGLAAQRASAGELVVLQRCVSDTKLNLDSGDQSLLYHIDHQFHRTIATMTHNSWIIRTLDMLLSHYLRFEDTSIYLNKDNAKKILDEHIEVCDAILKHDSKQAEEAIDKHLSNSYRRTVNKFWYD